MRVTNFAAIAVLLAALSGCAVAPPSPVSLDKAVLEGPARIGVAMTQLPKVDMRLPGAGCLLCIAAASIANSSLSAHTKTLPYEDIPQLKNQLAASLVKKGRLATVIEEPIDLGSLPDARTKGPNLAAKDFSSLQKKYGIDKLVVVDVAELGMERSYSAYIPNGAPYSVFVGTGYLVNLRTNSYEWYMPVRLTRAAEGEWDEPPKFPGLTSSYFQILELAKDEFLTPFSEQ